jgi:hypothetical protein
MKRANRSRVTSAITTLLLFVVASSCVAALSPPVARAATVYVSVDGSDTVGDGSAGAPFASPQRGIDVAALGDNVTVGQGTYHGDIELKNGVSLTGAGASNTTLAGSGTGPVIEAHGIDTTATLSGFTVTGGAATDGGGIYCSTSSLEVVNTAIAGNRADQRGGGVYGTESTLALHGCTINGNSAEGAGGGGGYFSSCSPTLSDCSIADNVAVHLAGGGIYFDSSSPALTGCSVTGNSASTGGGGIFSTLASVALVNCTIAANATGGYGGALYGSTSTSLIASCTITDNASSYGGGLYLVGGSPTITHCSITGNSSSSSAGGVACDASSPTIVECRIAANTAQGGAGGIRCGSGSSAVIARCTIADNIADEGSGGGVECSGFSSPALVNCVIAGNTASGDGGALYCYRSAPTLMNCTIADNTAMLGSGHAAHCYLSDSTVITNCVFWGNGDDLDGCSATYSDVTGGAGTNISADPCFVAAMQGDYRLRVDSPCVDRGTPNNAPADDNEGRPRPSGLGWDMGAHECALYTITPSANAGGGICPSTVQTVSPNADSAFAVRPCTGYHIVDVVVDGKSVGASSCVVFKRVSADHTLSAAFAIDAMVLPTCTRLVGPRNARIKHKYRLSGTVTPKSASGRVTISVTRKVGGAFRRVSTVKVDVHNGAFSCRLTPKHRGLWRFVASYSGRSAGATLYSASRSTFKTVRVK